jgi:hypothetical protein
VALNGVVALHDPVSDGYALLNLANGSLQMLDAPTEVWRSVLVSPDGQRWAAQRVRYAGLRGETETKQSANDLVVMAADGSLLATQPWSDDWRLGPAWLDAERLLVRVDTGRLLALNPFTGSQHTVRADFPQLYTDEPRLDWEGWGLTAYDPTLTRVVYLRAVAGTDTTPSFAYTLWDVSKGVALASFFSTFYPIPRWSADSTQFAIASNFLGQQTGFELYVMDREGQALTPLTSFSTYYQGLDFFGDLAWSPDGHSLAFWLLRPAEANSSRPEVITFEVVDVATRQVIDYCVPGGDRGIDTTYGYDPTLFWSLDSRQVVVRSQPVDQGPQTVLIDLAGNYAVQLSDHMEPVGWLAAP